MRIELFKQSGIDLVCDLFVRVFKNEPWNEHWKKEWVRERFLCVLNSEYAMGLIAMDGDRVAGAVLGRGLPFQGSLSFEIVELFVDTVLQNKGVGRKLLKQLETDLKLKGYTNTVLLTAKHSTPEKFYERCGYRKNDNLVFMFKSLVEN